MREPLPNLVFTRDSSIWIGPRVVIPTLALRARVREASLTDLIYAHHPRFTGVRRAYESRTAPVEGGDVLLLAPGVVAGGVGERTTPAGAGALARSLFDDDLANTVLAVPIAQKRAQMHLDTVCTMVDTDTVVMYANIVDTLAAFTIQRTPDGVTISDSAPFLEAAAKAVRALFVSAPGPREVVVSGRLGGLPGVIATLSAVLSDAAPVVALVPPAASAAAHGAALLADALAGGQHAALAEVLRLRECSGSVLDYLRVAGAEQILLG